MDKILRDKKAIFVFIAPALIMVKEACRSGGLSF